MTESRQKGGGKRIVVGGVQKRFWGGVLRRIYGMLSTPLSFPLPLPLSGRPLAKKVMSHSRDCPDVAAPSWTNIVPLMAVWNPLPFRYPSLKVPDPASSSKFAWPTSGQVTPEMNVKMNV